MRAALLYGIAGSAILPLGSAVAQTITIDLAGGGSVTRSVFNLFVVSTVLALAPSIVVVMTSFTRLIVVFSLLRSAIGLQQAPPNIVLTSLAVFMTMFIMASPIDAAIQRGIEPYLSGKIDETTALGEVTGPFRRFMLSNTRTDDLDIFIGFSKQNNPELRIEHPEDASLRHIVPAFMLSELRVAFEIGFLIYLPFLVIDLVISSILMATGMMMVPPVMISLPFKLIFFVYSDGWRLLILSLLQSYKV